MGARPAVMILHELLPCRVAGKIHLTHWLPFRREFNEQFQHGYKHLQSDVNALPERQTSLKAPSPHTGQSTAPLLRLATPTRCAGDAWRKGKLPKERMEQQFR